MALKFLKPKGSKFGNIRTRCNQNYLHLSKGESQHCNILFLVKASVGSDIQEIEHEIPYKLIVNDTLVCVHKPDWTITLKTGVKKIVEFKGNPTSEWRIKKNLFIALYPHIKYEVVFRNKLPNI